MTKKKPAESELGTFTCHACGHVQGPYHNCEKCGAPAMPKKVCVACKKKATPAGSLWFQSWCRFYFCEACWGVGSPTFFPGARTLYDKLVRLGAYEHESPPKDVAHLLGLKVKR